MFVTRIKAGGLVKMGGGLTPFDLEGRDFPTLESRLSSLFDSHARAAFDFRQERVSLGEISRFHCRPNFRNSVTLDFVTESRQLLFQLTDFGPSFGICFSDIRKLTLNFI